MLGLNQAIAVAFGAGLALLGPGAVEKIYPTFQGVLFPPNAPEPWACPAHNYTTELISFDPLLIYIHNFVSPEEARLVMGAGRDLLVPSPVTGDGSDVKSRSRTSWSAPLPDDDPAVQCVLSRASNFMGTLMAPGRDEMGTAQMVYYTDSQKFDLHHDWFQRPRLKDDDGGRKRMYNRVATFFVVLEANCTKGETYFPNARPIAPQDRGKPSPYWREHEDGGLAFQPIAGNALFWPNLLADGSGNPKTLHAGLPVGQGTKTAMNIWPRNFFGPEA
ncbi:unnamed protein product [Parascedosporium putredinis]|uniref:Prolyl 4-hydroxylase alpha subunit domain-containing protein n=1 Tax=Parascedosporium putredinis TaxID=1442378 RepID=A0A9P1GZH0_9PEZI|nr:unnamed protein product [Parascedosporium putredinis]CAI7990833.1 unnamed protein product [Parascedosporium putredinis]